MYVCKGMQPYVAVREQLHEAVSHLPLIQSGESNSYHQAKKVSHLTGPARYTFKQNAKYRIKIQTVV